MRKIMIALMLGLALCFPAMAEESVSQAPDVHLYYRLTDAFDLEGILARIPAPQRPQEVGGKLYVPAASPKNYDTLEVTFGNGVRETAIDGVFQRIGNTLGWVDDWSVCSAFDGWDAPGMTIRLSFTDELGIRSFVIWDMDSMTIADWERFTFPDGWENGLETVFTGLSGGYTVFAESFNAYYKDDGTIDWYSYTARDGEFVSYHEDELMSGKPRGSKDAATYPMLPLIGAPEVEATAAPESEPTPEPMPEAASEAGMRVYASLAVVGLDPSVWLADLPENPVIEGNVITLPDLGYAEVLSALPGADGVLEGETWVIDCAEGVEETTFIEARRMGDFPRVSYTWRVKDGLYEVSVDLPSDTGAVGYDTLRICFRGGEFAYSMLWGYPVAPAFYDADGQLMGYSVYFDDDIYAEFDPDNTLLYVEGVDDPDPADYPPAQIVTE